MKIEHVYQTQNNGRVIPITLCSYSDSPFGGNPMAASLHGWLSVEEVKRTLQQYRESDKQQKKA